MRSKRKINRKTNTRTSRVTSSKFKNKKDFFNNLLAVEEGQIKSYHYPYFFTHYPQWCCKMNVAPTFNDIKPYQWSKINSKMQDLYKDFIELDFYQKQEEKIKELAKNKPIQISSKGDLYIDQLLLDFIKARNNCRIITVFPNTNKEDFNKVASFVKSRYTLYAYKEVKLTGKGAMSLLYQLESLDPHNITYKDFEKSIEKLGWENIEDKHRVRVLVVELEQMNDVNKLDKELRTMIINFHLTKYFIQSVEIAQIYFNQNSIDFLERQDLKRHLGISFRKCRTFLNSFKKWLLKNCSLVDKDRFLVLSGCMLYTHGLRSCTDLDMFISPYPVPMGDELTRKVEKYLINEKKKLPFIDAYSPNLKWLDFWGEWHPKWASDFGAKNMLETIHNPKYHFYFMGVKFIILEAEISRRNLRSRPSAIADLIMMDKLMGIKIDINPVENMIIKDDKVVRYPRQYFASYVKSYLWKKYHYVMSLDEINKYITFVSKSGSKSITQSRALSKSKTKTSKSSKNISKSKK